MEDKNKTKERLIKELAELRRQVSKFKKTEARNKQVLEELKESEERFRKQYKNIPVPTYTWKRVGNNFVLADYNKATAKITGGKVADYRGMRVSEIHKDEPRITKAISLCYSPSTC